MGAVIYNPDLTSGTNKFFLVRTAIRQLFTSNLVRDCFVQCHSSFYSKGTVARGCLHLSLVSGLTEDCGVVFFMPTAPSAFFPTLQLMISRTSLINFLHIHLCLRVHFLVHLTCLVREGTSCPCSPVATWAFVFFLLSFNISLAFLYNVGLDAEFFPYGGKNWEPLGVPRPLGPFHIDARFLIGVANCAVRSIMATTFLPLPFPASGF